MGETREWILVVIRSKKCPCYGHQTFRRGHFGRRLWSLILILIDQPAFYVFNSMGELNVGLNSEQRKRTDPTIHTVSPGRLSLSGNLKRGLFFDPKSNWRTESEAEAYACTWSAIMLYLGSRRYLLCNFLKLVICTLIIHLIWDKSVVWYNLIAFFFIFIMWIYQNIVLYSEN